jgi:hypothetical protein
MKAKHAPCSCGCGVPARAEWLTTIWYDHPDGPALTDVYQCDEHRTPLPLGDKRLLTSYGLVDSGYRRLLQQMLKWDGAGFVRITAFRQTERPVRS